MEIVTTVWSAGAGIAIALAALCAAMWLAERRRLAMLLLCVLGIATAASTYGELGMMHAATTEEYGRWVRWYHVPIFFAITAQILFVHTYAGTGRVWLMWPIILGRLLLLIVNFLVQPSFNFSEIVSLRKVSLFGEEVSAIDVAVTRGWQWFSVAISILVMAYLIDAAVRVWLKGDGGSRRKALAITLGITVPLLGTIAYTQFLVFGLVQVPVSNVPWLLGALVLMASELGREFILSGRARLELAELRSNLAREERASVQGQLASALAHELSQPLHAISLNVAVAGKHLKVEKPDVQELRAILDDIDSDDRRAADIINRLRKLFPRHRTVETQPIKVEDVLADVRALVRAEAMSKHVTIDLVVPTELPRVLADRVHLSQVLLNLLANGIHAVESRPLDARHIVVEARADQAKGEVEIAVRDSGPGIPAAVGDSIFTPFFSTKLEGVGMGLAHCRDIMEAQGGRLWTDDKAPQEGAVFRLALRRV